MLTLEEIFPPFGLRIAGGGIEMRVMRDEDMPELVELVRDGIQAPDIPMPFLSDWHAQPLAPGTPHGFPTESLEWWWRQRAQFAPEDWGIALTVRRDGVLVGMQDMHAKHFPQTRHVETGSWLGLRHQKQGTGTLMRQLAVGFAFDELGAQSCGSGYIVGNHASAAVSRKTGYVENGRHRIVQHTANGTAGVDEQQVVVTPHTYLRPDVPVTIRGAGNFRRFIAVDS